MGEAERPEDVAAAWLMRLCQSSQVEQHLSLGNCECALSALWSQLAPLLGHQSVQAIFGRVIQTAQRLHPLAGQVRVTETGLDFNALRSERARLEDQSLAAAVEILARATAEVIVGLIGPGMLLTLLGDVEITLNRQGIFRCGVQSTDVTESKPPRHERKGLPDNG